MRNLTFTPEAWEEFEYWIEHQPETADKIRDLLKDCRRSPFSGLGKPEALKHHFAGCWSRRISREHRLVYRVTEETLWIISVRFHYKS